MRLHLVSKRMLNGYSLKMCQDYWHPTRRFGKQPITLERHISQLCQHYQVTFEELFTSLLMIKAFDTEIRCIDCGQMYEVFNPCQLPNPKQFLHWQCEDCQKFHNSGYINLQSFLASVEPDNEIPF